MFKFYWEYLEGKSAEELASMKKYNEDELTAMYFAWLESTGKINDC